MQILKKTNKTVLCRLLPLLALTLIVGAFLFAGTMTAYAAADPIIDMQTLSVDEVWLTGDTLHIAVTDKNSGESQTLELNLSDYAKPGDEYVTVQATDTDGRTSNMIQFKNPYYVPQTGGDNSGNGGSSPAPNGGTSESAVPDGSKPAGDGRPFTPDGTGTVVDNATDGDGKEFFTVETPDGNVFYLIVDRQRNADNVYLLNAVTENDLASLAKPGDGKSVSAVGTPTQPSTSAPPAETTPEPTPPPATEKNASDNTGTIIFIVIAVLVVGGAGYYFKILRPKQLGTSGGAEDYDEPEDDGDFDDDEEIDMTDGEGDEDE